MLKGIYAITPNNLIEEDLFKVTNILLKRGIPFIQLRDKNRPKDEKIYLAKEIMKMAKGHQTKIIINDDPYIAKQVKADGVHLGQEDASLIAARKLLGKDSIIGISCQDSLDLALKAKKMGANYVAFGSIFTSKTKLDVSSCSLKRLTYLVNSINLTSVAIGGISKNNIKELSKTNVDLIAISSGLFQGDIEENLSKIENIYSSF